MTIRVSVLVSPKELKNYFGKGAHWKEADWHFGSFKGRTEYYEVEFKPSGMYFRVHIESVDDPLDSEDMVTEDPAKAIVEFLGQDVPGSEQFSERLSSNIIKAILSFTEDSSGSEELEKLKTKMSKKGWKVHQQDDDMGYPELDVDISDMYHAKISVEGTMFEYKFGFWDRPDLVEEGITDDPIQEFRRYYKSDELESAYDEAKSKKEDLKAKMETDATVAP